MPAAERPAVAAERPSLGLLQTPVTALRGVAGRRAALLHRLGINTWQDLVSWYPRDFEDWSVSADLPDLQDGADQTFLAAVSAAVQVHRKGRLTILRTVLRAEGGAIAAVWFNQPWVADRLIKGAAYRFHGRIKRRDGQFSVQNPAFEACEAQPTGTVRAIYPLTEGLSQGILRQLVQSVLPQVIGLMPEPLPAWVRREHHLCAADFAISRIHQPASLEEADLCRRRLVFEELFLVQAGLFLLRRQRQQNQVGIQLQLTVDAREKLADVERALPFTLTDAQQRALAEIRRDLAAGRPMNRLVQGDVGSGKTVVAALSMLQASLCGCQAVLMAPTAILARQHFESLQRLLAASGEPIALLTGATPAAERRRLLAALQANEIRLLVGTHALIEDRVQLPNLALAITDEQHRFGVRQRKRLSRPAATDRADRPQTPVPADRTEPDWQPHVLVMSATPIPRTLALILYGDLDITLIDHLPAGRQPIATYTATSADRPRIETLIRRSVSEGRQVYVVCPMIEEQADSDLESVIGTYSRLVQTVFPDLGVGLLHGGLKPAAKDAVMASFMGGEIQVLVSTTVIEVGVDQPNATLMVIENAERFGLAQLHQLRGRIGRGSHRSVCILLSDTEDELARERLRTLCHARDGFAIAEKDLELRGPGDFFGTRQHGLPAFRLANLYRDRELLREVQACLEKLFALDPELARPEHRAIAGSLRSRYGDLFPPIDL